MASYFGDMLEMFIEFSFSKSTPLAQFTEWDLVFLLEVCSGKVLSMNKLCRRAAMSSRLGKTHNSAIKTARHGGAGGKVKLATVNA
ncbi:hypothetical protein EVAR_24985_1 [Eumeta japonica]|uniref:Uncharacterized protein n=1 Tax=Eumeta variegata TaxID=151549 RepID=A0A4C1XIF3_EUMVA|nr:hypothetical protein EVAR_24985_1 [Eumeta japonica]